MQEIYAKYFANLQIILKILLRQRGSVHILPVNFSAGCEAPRSDIFSLNLT